MLYYCAWMIFWSVVFQCILIAKKTSLPGGLRFGQHSRYALLPDSFASKTVRDKTKLASFYRLEPNAYRYWDCPNEVVVVAVAIFTSCVRLAANDS